MESLKRERQDGPIVKGGELRVGEPQLIGRGQRARSEAEDLRSKFARKPVPEVSPLEELARQRLADAQEVSSRLLEESSADAARIVSEAREEAEAILQQARAEAAADSARLEQQLRTSLDSEFKEKYAAGLQALSQAAAALEDARRELLASIELPAFELVQAIARQLLGQELQHRPELLVGLIRRALGMLSEGSGISLRLHPDVHATLTTDARLAAELDSCRRRGQRLELEPDPQLPASAFRLLTDGAEVAFDLDASIDRLEQLIADSLVPAAESMEQSNG